MTRFSGTHLRVLCGLSIEKIQNLNRHTHEYDLRQLADIYYGTKHRAVAKMIAFGSNYVAAQSNLSM